MMLDRWRVWSRNARLRLQNLAHEASADVLTKCTTSLSHTTRLTKAVLRARISTTKSKMHGMITQHMG